MTTLCPCGQPLHYTDPEAQATVERIVAEAGEHVLVYCGNGCYSVSRHYVALHGLDADELERLAAIGRIQKLSRSCGGCG